MSLIPYRSIAMAVFVGMCWMNTHSAHGDDNAFAPQPQAELKPMLSIDWKKDVDLPQGFQDSAFGLVHGSLVTVGGFCQGVESWRDAKELAAKKPGRYPRGFLKKAWSFDLKNSGKEWQTLPDFPGAARQGFVYTVVDDQFYCWGGFSYSEPFCYRDGFRLSYRQDHWEWDALPDLPQVNTFGSLSAIGTKIYLLGGSDYDSVKFHTNTDRAGNVKRFGAKLYVIDTKNLAAGWKMLSDLPGTPRFCGAFVPCGGKFYALGGATGDDNPTNKYATVVDNWLYDPASDSWGRLRDMPVASSNFPPGQLLAFNRYILLVGGYQYENMIGLDGQPKPVYGKPFKHYTDRDYYSDIFVYDTKRNEFGTATPLPLNNAGPMTLVEGDHVHIIGGETGGSEVEGEMFGHHPDLYLNGVLHEINP
jgi:N-acetylneuraminic acid mutarotase